MKINFMGEQFYTGVDLAMRWNVKNSDDIDDEKGAEALWDLSESVLEFMLEPNYDVDTKQCELYYLLQKLVGEIE